MRAYLEEYMREGCAEIGSIDVQLFLSGDVHILAARAVNFDSASGQLLAHSDR